MSRFDEYDDFDAVGLAELIRSRQVSSADVVEAAIERIETRNPAINAVVHTLYDQARQRAADPIDGPFSGVPFLVKDSGIQLEGERTSNGSRYWRDHVAVADSTVTRRYRAAGLVMLGFTNTAENGLACETAPAAYGPTRNPWNRELSAGGSSGGSGAAVAAGMVPASHATDGGGSIRIPSSCCGVFGLKPTRGRNPMGPDFGEGWNGLSVHHAITRTVRDNAALLDATHGPESGDPYAAMPPEGTFLASLDAPFRPLRIAFQTVTHDGEQLHPTVASAVREVAALLAEMGHHVDEIRPDLDAAALRAAMFTIVASNTANVLVGRERLTGRAATEDEVEPITHRWAQEGHRLTGQQLAAAITTIHQTGRRLGRFFDEHDLLVTPTFATPLVPIGTVDMQRTDLPEYFEVLSHHTSFTTPYSATGVPAANVPVVWTDGLPVGVQIAAPIGHDARVLQVAAQLERVQPWLQRRPSW